MLILQVYKPIISTGYLSHMNYDDLTFCFKNFCLYFYPFNFFFLSFFFSLLNHMQLASDHFTGYEKERDVFLIDSYYTCLSIILQATWMYK